MAFGQSTFSFSTPQQQSPSPLFSTPSQQQQQQQQQQQALQQVHLLTKDKAPVTYHTKWADLHPDSQNFLLQIEARILEYRDESRRLDQCDRLFNSLALNEGFELDATRISQELGGISTSMERDKISLQELMKTAKDLMRNAEVAVRSFVILKSRFSRTVAPAHASNSVPSTGIIAPSIGIGTSGPAQAVSSTLPIVDFYSGVPVKPSPFLLHTISRFEHQLQEFRQWVEELERLLYADTDGSGKDSSHLSLLQSLPMVLTNIHDFFIHVAAKVETLHQQIWSRRTTYLANQRKRGDDNNPFLEADRREVAKKEAAAKRVHPSLQASTVSQLTTQAAGLLSNATPSNATPSSAPSSGSASSPSLLFSGSTPFAGFNTSGSLTSASAPSSSTPSLSLFGSTSAPSPSIFGSSAPSTTPSLFGSGPSSSIFGSSAPSTTPSLFGSGPSSSIFGSGSAGGTSSSPLSAFASAPAASSSGSLFGATQMPSGGLFGSSTPSLGGQAPGSIFGNPAQPLGAGSGAPAFGMGTTQGTTTTKAKSRTTRRK